MAGTPQKRAKRQLEVIAQLAEEHPEIKAAILDDAQPQAPALNARTRAREKLRAALSAGPATRAAVDSAVGDEIGRLAEALRPGLTARIARMRPIWAAGWIEDYPIDSGKLGELLEYLAAEHGGQTYRVTLLGPDGQPYLDAALPIAGPPRRRGRPVDRESWDGEAAPRTTTQAQPQPAPQNELFKLFEMMLDNERHASERLLTEVRQLISTTGKGNDDLLKSVIAARKSEIESHSFTHQIGELAKAAGALEEVKAALTASDKSAVVEKDADDNLNGVFKDAAKDFISKAMMTKFTKRPNNGHADTAPPIPPAKIES